MRIGVSEQILNSGLDQDSLYSHLIIEHKGEILYWDCKQYNVMAITPPDVTFKMINHLFTFMGEDRQNKLFELYKGCNRVLSSIDIDTNLLIKNLQERIHQIYRLVTEEELKDYLRNKVNLEIPANVDTVYNPDFENESSYRERTYLVEDYRQLVVLALSLRLMIPIWGAYLPKATTEFGKEKKELACYRLLNRTWILQSEATKKLFKFISLNNDNDNSNFSAILHGEGSFALPESRLATGLVRRLTMGILSSRANNDSLVSNIHNYLCESRPYKQNNRRAGKDITDKFKSFRGDDTRDSLSRMDMYRALEEVSSGDVVHLNSDAERIYTIIDKVDPTVIPTFGEDMIADILSRNSQDEEMECKFQENIARWVLHPAITARAFPNITGRSVLGFLAATQVILWHWGFHSLAALITARPYLIDEDEFGITGHQARTRPSKELVDELLGFYPHFYLTNAANLRDDIDKQRRYSNPALNQIDVCVKEMVVNEWIVNVPDALRQHISAHPQSSRMLVPNDIKTQLVKLMIKINTRTTWLPQLEIRR